MRRPSVPSVQHLARTWQPDPALTAKTIVRLFDNPPPISYAPLMRLVKDHIALAVPLAQIRLAINRKYASEIVRRNYLELLSLVSNEFSTRKVDFVHEVAGRLYPLSRELAIPFAPPLIYGAGGQLNLPWLSFWRTNPLAGEKLSLFATLATELLDQDADLDAATFECWDLSAAAQTESRRLTVFDLRMVPRLNQSEKMEMLSIYQEGYRLALLQIASRHKSPPVEDVVSPEGQRDMFHEGPER